MLEQREKCPKCHSFHWEWGTDDEPLEPYEADGFHCPGCEHVEVEAERRKDQPESFGVSLVLFPKGMTHGS